jgi:hypothetical protein
MMMMTAGEGRAAAEAGGVDAWRLAAALPPPPPPPPPPGRKEEAAAAAAAQPSGVATASHRHLLLTRAHVALSAQTAPRAQCAAAAPPPPPREWRQQR